MNFSRAIGAEIRRVRDVERAGEPMRVVEGSRLYRTEVDDVWDAMTNADRVARWFLPIEGELRRGGRYRLEGNAEGTIERCDPPTALDLTWEYGKNVSWVQVRLEAEDDGARLTLRHVMPKDEAGEAHWATYGAGAAGVGWDLSFLGMALECGDAPIDRAKIDAWSASEAGKAFLRECADAWGHAEAAAGEDADVARDRGMRTADFYTGESTATED